MAVTGHNRGYIYYPCPSCRRKGLGKVMITADATFRICRYCQYRQYEYRRINGEMTKVISEPKEKQS